MLSHLEVVKWEIVTVEIDFLGDVAPKIIDILQNISAPLCAKHPSRLATEPPTNNDSSQFDDDDPEEEALDIEDDAAMRGIEMKMASDSKAALDRELGGNWNVLVGSQYWCTLNLAKKDRHGTFKFGEIEICVFEANVNPWE